MRRALIATAVTAALSVSVSASLGTSPASADSKVTVSGLEFPSTDTYLTYFGCQDLYHADARAPQVRIDRGGAPAGRRSFALLMPGQQTAAGPVHKVSSVADTTVAGLYARGGSTGTTGVAYVWYVTGALAPGQVWAGKADLEAGADWGYVNTAAASYDWKLLDAATGDQVRDGGSATLADFTDVHGDGPGYLLSGFGCNGGEFSIDALRYGSRGNATTYDLEGIRTKTFMKRSASKVKRGQSVTLTGSVVDDATRAPVGAAMVLQAKPAGAERFRDVGGAVPASTDGYVRKVVKPKVTTSYRWSVPAEGYADASTSRVVTVVVQAAGSQPTQQPGGDTSGPSSDPGTSDPGEMEVPPLPTQSPSPTPTGQSSAGSGDSPTAEPDTEPETEPETEPTETPTTEATEPATGEATDATP